MEGGLYHRFASEPEKRAICLSIRLCVKYRVRACAVCVTNTYYNRYTQKYRLHEPCKISRVHVLSPVLFCKKQVAGLVTVITAETVVFAGWRNATIGITGAVGQ